MRLCNSYYRNIVTRQSSNVFLPCLKARGQSSTNAVFLARDYRLSLRVGERLPRDAPVDRFRCVKRVILPPRLTARCLGLSNINNKRPALFSLLPLTATLQRVSQLYLIHSLFLVQLTRFTFCHVRSTLFSSLRCSLSCTLS
jgi:hypothetical protein